MAGAFSFARRIVWFLLFAALALPASVAAAPATSGHTTWNNWTFDWVLGQNCCGLALKQVRYKNELSIYKIDLPVIRVQYNSSCGPYADQLCLAYFKTICNTQLVCQQQFSLGGQTWLVIWAYAEIGSYKLIQAYYFRTDGYLLARLGSKGLQCYVTHRHHPYWQIDADINGFAGDQVWQYDNPPISSFPYPLWTKYSTEVDGMKDAAHNRSWLVLDGANNHGLYITPSVDDELKDGFAPQDFGVRRWHPGEGCPWPFGPWGQLGYNNGENVNGQDVVFWYVAHKNHVPSLIEFFGGGSYKWMGPILKAKNP